MPFGYRLSMIAAKALLLIHSSGSPAQALSEFPTIAK